MQNKCIRLCLKLDKMHHISEEEFRLVNWLPTSKKVDQCINTVIYNPDLKAVSDLNNT